MTTTAEPLLPPARSSFYDRWLGRLAADPVLARRWGWLAPLVITVLAGILRLWNLGHPHELIFDETYYVKDAWSQWNLGYPATWPDKTDERFEAGETDIFFTTGSFVVHPPLGKWIIGLGMWIFGADSSFGWRVSVAVFGTATVLVLYAVAKVLSGSIAVASIASGLLAIDGLAIVMSRVAVLDAFVAFFTLLTLWFVLLDRRSHLARLDAAIRARTGDGDALTWGPLSWNRPWIVAAGLAAGATTAVKWSGLYVMVAVALYIVVTDALVRRRAGVTMWPLDAVRQGLVAAVLAVPAAVVVYLASWTGWLVTTAGYGRGPSTGSGTGVGSGTGAGSGGGWWESLGDLWTYHEAMYGFHVGLSAAHGYASPAWQWPLLVRPTSMFYQSEEGGQAGCAAANGCVQNIYSMPNPLIWYAAVAACLYIAWRFFVTRDWRYAFVLTGVAATYVPWLLYPARTIFQFYTVAILPFMLLALAFALKDVASGRRDASGLRRMSGQRVVLVYLAFVVLLSAFWFPVLIGASVPYDFWRLHNWIQTWV